MTRTELWVVRHGESVWNAAGRWQGQGDPALTAHGRAQVRALARALADAGIERIVSSDLRRALETARLLAEACGLDVRSDPDLRERDLGAWTGLDGDAIARQWPGALERLRRDEEGFRPGGGETLAELRRRLQRALARLEAGSRIAVVTHLGAIRAWWPGTELQNAGWLRIRASEAWDALEGLAGPAAGAARAAAAEGA